MLAVAKDIGRQNIFVYKNDNEVVCTLSQGSLGLLFYNQGEACADLFLAPFYEELYL